MYIYFWVVVHSFYKCMTNFDMSDRLNKDMVVLGCSVVD